MIHRIRLAVLGTFAALGLLGSGCGRSDSPASGPTGPTPATNAALPVLKFHWVGKKQIVAANVATNFLALWNLPQSARLEAQTLEKLATAPWRLWATNVALSNAPSAQLRPLLDDLLQEEVYFEAQGDTNHLNELVLAVRLPADRAALWLTNLAMILESLVGGKAVVAGGNFQLLASESSFLCARSGNWTLLSVAFGCQTSNLLTACQKQIASTQAPFPPRITNYWLEFQANLAALPRLRVLQGLGNNQPLLDLKVVGENKNVRTTGELIFPGAAPIEMETWNIPTNLIHDPLISFTTMRGFRPLLSELSLWNTGQLGPVPNQATFWAQSGIPALRFFAFPSIQASNQIRALNDFLLKEINPHMANFPNTTNIPLGLFERSPDGQRLRWRGIPYLMPNLDVAGAQSNWFVAGGLFANRMTNQPIPAALIDQFTPDSNLFFYHWESSNQSAFGLIQVSQALRFVFGRNRLSLTNNASLPWLVAVSSNLVSSSTALRLMNSNSVSIYRSSTIGLTSLEIHLLADWLESPEFPVGLHTTLAIPEKRLRRLAVETTNAPPSSTP